MFWVGINCSCSTYRVGPEGLGCGLCRQRHCACLDRRDATWADWSRDCGNNTNTWIPWFFLICHDMSWYVQILKLTMMDEPWRCQNRLFYSCWGCGQRAGSPAPEWLTSRWWWVASTKKCDRLYACDVLDNCLDLQGMMLGMFKIVQVFFDFRPWALEWEIICGDEGANQHMKSTYAGKCQVSHP